MNKNVIICAIALLLSGCFDLHQSIVINDDRTASYQMELRMSSVLLSMVAEQAPGEDDIGFSTESFCNDNELVERDIPEGMDVAVDSYLEDQNLVCSYEVSGPLDKFVELNMQGDTKQGQGDLVTIVPLEDDRVEITSRFDFSDWKTKEGGSGESNDEMAQQMISAIMAGRVMRWSVTAPQIIESNGEISEDGKTATWELPLSLAISEKGTYEFRTVADYHTPWYQGVLTWLKFW